MGFQFARENSERIKSITFMEAIVMPMVWDQWPEMARKIFGLYRSEAGEELILEKNYFVEKILFLDAPNLSEEDKNEYVTLAKIKFFRDALGFIDEQRRLDDAKRLIIPPRSQAFMEKIIDVLSLFVKSVPLFDNIKNLV